jgi:hypothetical protein
MSSTTTGHARGSVCICGHWNNQHWESENPRWGRCTVDGCHCDEYEFSHKSATYPFHKGEKEELDEEEFDAQ